MRREVLVLGALFAAAACTSARGGMNAADSAHVDRMAHEHAGQTPTANAAGMAPRQEVAGEDVVYGNAGGREMRGYMARPASATASAALPSVIMIHEWWGLNDNVRMMARRLAGEGYRVLAVDLYEGRVAANPQEARTFYVQVMQNRPAAVQNLGAATEFLRTANRATKLGVVGWCFGGGWSLQTGLSFPEKIDAVAIYYGQPVTDRAELAKLRAPVAGFFGLKDQGIPADSVRAMESQLQALGKTVDIRFYDANHAFANPSGQSYDAAAAADAWTRTLAFFDRYLKH